MPIYRMYLLDEGGKFCDVRQFFAVDDADARDRSRALSDGQRWELWLSAELIAQGN